MTYYEKEQMNRKANWELQVLNEGGNWDALPSNDPKQFNHFFPTRAAVEAHKAMLNIVGAIYRTVEA